MPTLTMSPPDRTTQHRTTTRRLTGRRAPDEAANPEWVLAAPFRAHVTHLMETAQVPWPIVAYQAGVPLATLRTLLFGRHGKARIKITHQAATQLIDVRTEDLRWMRHSQISAERTGTRIRLLRSRHMSWEQIAEFLDIDISFCQSLARNERTCCSVMVDILAQSACETIGLSRWDDIDAQ